MICAPPVCPHLSGQPCFTPQALGPFSFGKGAKEEWIYKKQFTEPYSSHLFWFFTASAVAGVLRLFLFFLCCHGLRLWFINSDNFLWVSFSLFLIFFLSAWQTAICSLRIIFPSCTFATLGSKLLKMLMNSGAWIIMLDICHRANAKCMACVQYQKAKGCRVREKRKCFLYSVWHDYLETCFYRSS